MRTPNGPIAPATKRSPCGPPRDRRALLVDGADLIAQAVPVELEPVSAECVRLDHVGAGGDVGPMDALDEGCVRDVELIEAAIQEHAQLVQTGSHGAVEEHDAFGEDGWEILLHG
jgi:hypothetical protein